MVKRKKKEKQFGPVSILFIIFSIISILSLVFSVFGIEAYKTVIANNTLESTLVTVKNIISIEGIQYLFTSIVENFQKFEPLVLMIIALLGIGICEKSGLIYTIVNPLKKIKFNIIIFLTLLIGVIFTVIGDYSYIFLIPLTGVVYKYLEKNPMLGIMIMFIGITLGYGTGLIFNYNDHLIGILTESAASLEVDKNYKFSLFSNLYIMWGSTLIITILSTMIIDKFLCPKFTKKYENEEEIIENKKAKKITFILFILLIVLTVYFILPIKLPFAGILLNNEEVRYIEKLFGETSPFGNSLVFIISIIMIILGYVYGKISGNIKDSHEFSLGLSKNFENLGFLFVLMFLIAEIIAVIEWTNIGIVIGSKLIEFLGTMKISGVILIILFMIIVILISILIPDTLTKWELMSPTIVPLFMQANITPGFTTFIFKVSDGIGKCLSPIFIYFIIMLAFLEKYRVSEKKQISLFGIYKMMLPTVSLISLVWVIIIALWYLIGLPIGIGISSTL